MSQQLSKSYRLVKYLKWTTIGISVGIGVGLVRRYMNTKTCPSGALLNGKTVIITGANTGIGKATALELAKRHGRIIMACRDLEKAEQAARNIRDKTSNGELIVRQLDLASLSSVREFAKKISQEEDHVDVLINNAGVFKHPYQITEDGFEMQMAVNHFGHFLLTNLLLDKLKASAPSRVVVVSAALHKRGRIDFDNLHGRNEPSATGSYNDSKLANNLFARELARRTASDRVSVYCLRPGMVRTQLGRHLELNPVLRLLTFLHSWLFMFSPSEGCQTVVYCAVAEELEGATGRFYANCKEEPWTPVSLDDELAARLWEASEKLTGISH